MRQLIKIQHNMTTKIAKRKVGKVKMKKIQVEVLFESSWTRA